MEYRRAVVGNLKQQLNQIEVVSAEEQNGKSE